MKRNTCRALLCLALSVLLVFSALPLCIAADAAFEKSIADFPESYRVKLRELHAAHPNWEFTAIDTGVDWGEAVDVESSGGRSLVEISDNYANAFKSKNTGDYNYSSSSYIQKDGGFCTANKFCVSYYMDPRNFLNEENIFQFELLSFDDSFTVEAVDLVLSGTFMYHKKITYVTSSGESKTMKQTYAQVMYEAGMTYDVNRCSLPSKIRNEIGSTPSGSVTGRNSSYPGIYNFYNIGASDGAGAITRGLAWAASTKDGSYGRPWTDPKKSIMGGAEFLVNTYIGKGQFTGYYQRFNVNPDGYYNMFDHQYMTNISGAASQGYSSYRSYLSMGLLDMHFIFSLPVYKNMPGAADNSGTLQLADAASQTVKVSTSSAVNVRTGPSTNYDKMAFTVSPGTQMTVLGTYVTDSHYYDSILRYPVWYRVKFVYDGTAYKGYIPAGFTTVQTQKTVAPGLYVPKFTTTNSSLFFKYVSMDARICTVVEDTKLKFLKEGSCFVLAYDSTGRYAMVNYKVSSAAGPNDISDPGVTVGGIGQVSGLSETKVSASGFTLSWNAVPDATGYRIYRYNSETGKQDVVKNTKKTSYAFKNLAAGTTLQLRVRAYSKDSSGNVVWGTPSAPFNAITIPPGPEQLSQSDSTSNSVTLEWSPVKGANRYQLVKYDTDLERFVSVQLTEGNTLSVSALLPATDYLFKVRAVVTIGGKDYYTPYSTEIAAKCGPSPVTGLVQSDAQARSVTLAWDPCSDAQAYEVFRFEADTGMLTSLGRTKNTSYTIGKLPSGSNALYVVKSYRTENGTVFHGTASEEVFATTLPSMVIGLRQYSTKQTCLKLTWSPVSHASGYCVYSVRADGTYKKISKVENNKAVVKGLKPGTKYQYAVRAFIRANGKVYWGAYSDIYTAKTNPAKA